MIKQLFFLFLFLFIFSLQLFSQKLIYKSNGNILNSNGQELSSNLVRIVLRENQQLLKNYNAARTKKTLEIYYLFRGQYCHLLVLSLMHLQDLMQVLHQKMKK